MRKKDIEKWFSSKNLSSRDYQIDLLFDVDQSFQKISKPAVLAACPSAGKTIMSIAYVDLYLKANPTHRVLILTHGTKILRTQYYDELNKIKDLNFEYSLVDASSKGEALRKQVLISIPQSVKNKDIGDFNLIVIDEAHQYYFAKTDQQIIKKTKAKKQLLLTGTPSEFILKKYPVYAVAVNELLKYGVIQDLYVELVSSTYNFSMSNYNKDQELKLGAKITKKDTEATLDDILKHVIDIVHPTDSSWDGALVAMNKTMIACRRQNQAMYVKKYLAKKNITSSLSICDTDSKSEEIEKFKNDKNSSVLIVVGRGILGFNYPDLINVIDMTCSQNINKIFQLMARVLRKKETYQKKVYYKVFPHKLSIKFNYIMNVVMCLTDREYFLKFTGKNEDELKIPIKRLPGFGGPSIGPGPGPDPKIDPKIEDLEEELINYSGIPTIEFFNKILNQKNEDVFSPLAWTTIKEVNDKISKIQNKQYLPNHWNLENCIASASRWINRKLWKENEQSAYNAARINGWLEICCKHMDKTDNNINWTLELCLASAKKCGSVKEWMNVDINAYLAARRHDWFGICSAHMTKRNRTEWTLNLLKIDRAKHPSKNAWKKNSRTAYKAAQRNGWLKEIE